MIPDELKEIIKSCEDVRKSIRHHAICGTEFYALLCLFASREGLPLYLDPFFPANTLRIYNSDDECLKEISIH